MAQLTTLQQKEQEYRRMNEEMEHKTALLMQEAEQMLLKHEALLTSERTLPDTDTSITKCLPSAKEHSLMAAVDDELEFNDYDKLSRDISVKSQLQRRVLLSATERPGNSNLEIAIGRKSAPPPRGINLPIEPDEEEADPTGIIPPSANQMSIDAQLRFFKAKVRVLQEELDRTQHELALRSREADSYASKLQEADEEKGKFSKQVANLQQALTKHKKLADDNEARANALERSIESIRREADAAKRENKKAANEKSAHEVRLNRAVEEAENLRQELAKARAQVREANTDEVRKNEKLNAELRRLERQRIELIGAFKKSLKLIDILKRQKLHLEAARLLQFREEEFIKALDWDKQAPPITLAPEIASGNSRNKMGLPKKIIHNSSSAKTTSSSGANRIEVNPQLIMDGYGESVRTGSLDSGEDT